MYQYRIFNQAGLYIQRIVYILAFLALLFLGNQLVRIFNVARRLDPIVGLIYLVVLALIFLVIILRYYHHKRDHRILWAKGFKLRGQPSHASLKNYVRYLVHYIKRLSGHLLLNDAQAAVIHQKALDIQESLHHHPLNDDLLRSIASARDTVIAPTFRVLDVLAEKVTLSKAKAVIQDIYEPPFPIISPLVVFYHQVTLISEITDIYISKPSLHEYCRVLKDVWQIMTKGDFMRYGQRLFSGINSNAYSLGRAGDDLGQAFSIIWLTHAISLAAANRCCTLHDWEMNDAIDDMNIRIVPCLEKTRDVLLNDAMPVLKKRIRHYTPVDHDPNEFVENITTSFIKSVDSVVIAISTANRNAPQSKTSPGLVAGEHAEPLADVFPESKELPAGTLRHRTRRRRRSRSKPRMSNPLSSLIQRFVYLFMRPKY